MKPRINCISLPVDDIQKSLSFYKDGLGFPAQTFGEEADHIVLDLQSNLCLVLILRSEFTGFTKLANQTDAARGSSECILSYFAESREEVDAILQRVEAVGGSLAGEPKDQPWGYAACFTDPDGHIWEVMWNPKLPVQS